MAGSDTESEGEGFPAPAVQAPAVQAPASAPEDIRTFIRGVYTRAADFQPGELSTACKELIRLEFDTDVPSRDVLRTTATDVLHVVMSLLDTRAGGLKVFHANGQLKDVSASQFNRLNSQQSRTDGKVEPMRITALHAGTLEEGGTVILDAAKLGMTASDLPEIAQLLVTEQNGSKKGAQIVWRLLGWGTRDEGYNNEDKTDFRSMWNKALQSDPWENTVREAIKEGATLMDKARLYVALMTSDVRRAMLQSPHRSGAFAKFAGIKAETFYATMFDCWLSLRIALREIPPRAGKRRRATEESDSGAAASGAAASGAAASGAADAGAGLGSYTELIDGSAFLNGIWHKECQTTLSRLSIVLFKFDKMGVGHGAHYVEGGGEYALIHKLNQTALGAIQSLPFQIANMLLEKLCKHYKTFGSPSTEWVRDNVNLLRRIHIDNMDLSGGGGGGKGKQVASDEDQVTSDDVGRAAGSSARSAAVAGSATQEIENLKEIHAEHLHGEIEKLKKIHSEIEKLKKKHAELEKKNEDLKEENQDLKKEIAELKPAVPGSVAVAGSAAGGQW